MSKRIMYSVIPSVVDQNQIIHTKGVVDQKAMNAAISGASDIIRLGTKSCVGELHHWGGFGSKSPSKPTEEMDSLGGRMSSGGLKLQERCTSLLETQEYGKALEICIRAFGNPDKWARNFGGEAWKKIAVCLSNIETCWRNLSTLKASRGAADPTYYDKVIAISQQLIIYLNVFDGLSHNTASVMENLVQNEYEESGAKPVRPTKPDGKPDMEWDEFDAIQDIIDNEIKVITRLMDSKELEHPADVFNEIESTLTNSGDINRYKDYTPTLRNQMQGRNPAIKDKEMSVIRLRKDILPYRQEVMKASDTYREALAKAKEPEADRGLVIKLNDRAGGIMNRMVTISKRDKDARVESDYKETRDYIQPIVGSIAKLMNHWDTYNRGVGRTVNLESIQHKLDMTNKLMHYMDSI